MDLPRILPRGDAGLMDKYQCVQSSIVLGLLREGDIHYPGGKREGSVMKAGWYFLIWIHRMWAASRMLSFDLYICKGLKQNLHISLIKIPCDH